MPFWMNPIGTTLEQLLANPLWAGSITRYPEAVPDGYKVTEFWQVRRRVAKGTFPPFRTALAQCVVA